MYDFKQLEEVKSKIKNCLETEFGLIYIEQKDTNKNNETDNNISNNLELFKIDKKGESIFQKIKSVDSLNDVKKEIKEKYEKFSNDFLDYFDRVENQLSPHNINSFEIIDKSIKNRKKKLEHTIKKFKIEDNWNVSKIKEEFYFRLQKNFEDIITTLLNPLSVGLKENTAYEGIIKLFNQFLSNLGIYTKEIKANERYDDNHMLRPVECDDCETTDISKKDIIKEVISYPYLIDDEVVVKEGEIILWKVKRNG